MVSQAMKYSSYMLGPLIVYLGHIFLLHHGIVKMKPELQLQFLLIPVYGVILFGLYSVATIVYGVLTFNDCQAASDELRKGSRHFFPNNLVEEIVEARKDLAKKGFKFD